MGRVTKRFKQIGQITNKGENYSLADAVEGLKKCPAVKFDQTVELSMKIGVDPKKADQQVRGTLSLPHGTGKSLKVIVVTQGEKVDQAIQAGAEEAGGDEIIDKIKGGWTDFDALIATPDMMRKVGMLGKILGPRGLMPTPKAGTVTADVAKAVTEIKGGKVEFKVDKNSNINLLVGKLSFEPGKLVDNIKALLSAIVRAKPASAKGQYIRSLFLSSTMGPGMRIDLAGLDLG